MRLETYCALCSSWSWCDDIMPVPVDTTPFVDTATSIVDTELDKRKAYQREWLRKKRASA